MTPIFFPPTSSFPLKARRTLLDFTEEFEGTSLFQPACEPLFPLRLRALVQKLLKCWCAGPFDFFPPRLPLADSFLSSLGRVFWWRPHRCYRQLREENLSLPYTCFEVISCTLNE